MHFRLEHKRKQSSWEQCSESVTNIISAFLPRTQTKFTSDAECHQLVNIMHCFTTFTLTFEHSFPSHYLLSVHDLTRLLISFVFWVDIVYLCFCPFFHFDISWLELIVAFLFYYLCFQGWDDSFNVTLINQTGINS